MALTLTSIPSVERENPSTVPSIGSSATGHRYVQYWVDVRELHYNDEILKLTINPELVLEAITHLHLTGDGWKVDDLSDYVIDTVEYPDEADKITWVVYGFYQREYIQFRDLFEIISDEHDSNIAVTEVQLYDDWLLVELDLHG